MTQVINKNHIKDLSGLIIIICLFLISIVLLSVAKGGHFSNFFATSAEAIVVSVIVSGGTRLLMKSWRHTNNAVLAAWIIFLLPYLSKIGSNGIASLQWASFDEVSQIAENISKNLPKNIGEDITWKSANFKDRSILLSFYKDESTSNNTNSIFKQWIIDNYCNPKYLKTLTSAGISISFTLSFKNDKSIEFKTPEVCSGKNSEARGSLNT